MQATIEPVILGINADIFHLDCKASWQGPLNKHLACVLFQPRYLRTIFCAQRDKKLLRR